LMEMATPSRSPFTESTIPTGLERRAAKEKGRATADAKR